MAKPLFIEFYEDFVNKYKKDFPSAVKALQNSINSALAFFDFPSEDWVSIRTTNVIERLNKEFKRRTKSMEILAALVKLLQPACIYCTKDGKLLGQ